MNLLGIIGACVGLLLIFTGMQTYMIVGGMRKLSLKQIVLFKPKPNIVSLAFWAHIAGFIMFISFSA